MVIWRWLVSLWRKAGFSRKAYNLRDKEDNSTMKAAFLGVFKGKYLRGKNKVSFILTKIPVIMISQVNSLSHIVVVLR